MSRPAHEPRPALRALVIDDEPSVRRILCRVLERSGWEVEEACDASEAAHLLGHARARQYTMVLCDLHLPDGSGLDLRRLAMQQAPSIGERFVLMTGHTLDALEPDVREGLEVLGKPFTLDELMAVQGRMASAGR